MATQHMTALTITVTDHPVIPAPRPRNNGGKRAYMPGRYVQWQQITRGLILDQRNRARHYRQYDEPLSVNLAITKTGFRLTVAPVGLGQHYGRVPSAIRRTVPRGDIDNCAKAVLDAANGVLWTDDSLVHDPHVWFEDDEVAG